MFLVYVYVCGSADDDPPCVMTKTHGYENCTYWDSVQYLLIFSWPRYAGFCQLGLTQQCQIEIGRENGRGHIFAEHMGIYE